MSSSGSVQIVLEDLQEAYEAPWSVSDRWRAQGGQVVGMFGRCAPRELVSAAGMLPVRLDPERLRRAAGEAPAGEQDALLASVLEGLSGELPQSHLAIIAALLDRRLDWIDGLLIGRDTEAHTKLFYVLREMASDVELGPFMPRFAFSDVLRLPTRTSAVYNRRRLRELQQTIGGWAGLDRDEDRLAAAVEAEVGLAAELRRLEGLRADGRLSGYEMFTARRAASVLPSAEALVALDSLASAAGPRPPRPGPRVFLTGSEPGSAVYQALEAAGFWLVGDDHSDDPSDRPEPKGEAIDWLSDRYQYSAVGAARAGLGRVAATVARVRALDVAVVVQLLAPADEACEWELNEFRGLLPTSPLIAFRLEDDPDLEAVAPLVSQVAELLASRTAQLTSHATRDA